MNSDPAEAPTSSVLAAPPTTDRISLLHQGRNSGQSSPIAVPKQLQNGTQLTGFRNISGISGVSTIDAPQEVETEREREHISKQAVLPALTAQSSAPQQVFETSQLHRYPEERREVYPNAGFRPQEGAFGTPTPLPASTAAP